MFKLDSLPHSQNSHKLRSVTKRLNNTFICLIQLKRMSAHQGFFGLKMYFVQKKFSRGIFYFYNYHYSGTLARFRSCIACRRYDGVQNLNSIGLNYSALSWFLDALDKVWILEHYAAYFLFKIVGWKQITHRIIWKSTSIQNMSVYDLHWLNGRNTSDTFCIVQFPFDLGWKYLLIFCLRFDFKMPCFVNRSQRKILMRKHVTFSSSLDLF